MHILTITSLFPNSLQPLHGIFIQNRMENYTKKYGHKWSVIAPIPFYPKLPFATIKEYDRYARIPSFENSRGYPVYHPRYLVTPKVGMRYYGSWFTQGILKKVIQIHAENPIDLIDGHYVYPDGQAAVDLGRKLGVPVILSARGTDLSLFPRFPAIRKKIVNILSKSNHLICVSNELKKIGIELGLSEKNISVIGNGIDANRFQIGDKNFARQKLKLPTHKKIILSVGRMNALKGFHILIKALAKLPNPKDYLLIIAGEGEEKKSLINLTRELEIEEQVLFPGGILNEALPTWYQAADLFALASSREGWPNVICEAQACGLPVVATPITGIRSIISEPYMGLFVDSREAESFAKTFLEAFTVNWDFQKIAEKGKERTWETVSQNLHKLVESVVKV